MKESKAEVLLHPVRLKIVQEFLGGEKLTAKEIVKKLTSISQATLYRHLDKLVQHNILEVVEENPIRGTVEKVYTLNVGGANIGKNDISQNSREELMNFFMIYITQIMSSFETYLSQDHIDLEKDGVGYRLTALHLTDEEFGNFIMDLANVFKKVSENEPTPERTKRIISTIFIPENKKGE